MKKMKPAWVNLVLVLIGGWFIHSCGLDDSDSYSPWVKADQYALATICSVDDNGKEYYFLLDGNQKLYPGDLSKISSSYKWKDGQRAVIYFNLLDQKVPGYDYHAEIVLINNVLTKDIIPLTEETADSIGDDRIDIDSAWFGGNYLNITFTFKGYQNPDKLHMVNLVRNETDESVADENYLVLEFRHNAYDDYGTEVLKGIASFKLSLTEEETTKYQGIKVCFNSIYGGTKFKECNFKESNDKVAGTTFNYSDVK